MTKICSACEGTGWIPAPTAGHGVPLAAVRCTCTEWPRAMKIDPITGLPVPPEGTKAIETFTSDPNDNR